VRRSLLHERRRIDPDDFTSATIPRLLSRAQACEVPMLLFTGPGGSGKTTQLLRCAYDLHSRDDAKVVVLRHRLGYDLSLEEIRSVQRSETDSVIAVAVDDAGKVAHPLRDLRRNLQDAGVPALLLCAERINAWPADVIAETYELRQLEPQAAEQLLDRLARHDLLGVLEDLPREEQLARILGEYDRQLLVTLREATEGKRFDEIVEEEYRQIRERRAREVYLYTCMFERTGLQLPVECAWSVARVQDRREFRSQVLRHCRRLVELVRSGEGWVCRAQHRIIAEVLCRRVLSNADAALECLADLVAHVLPVGAGDELAYRLTWKLLASPPCAEDLDRGDPSILVDPLKPLGPRLHPFLKRMLYESKWHAGPLKLALCVLGRGLHEDDNLEAPFLVRILQNAKAKLGRPALIDACRPVLAHTTFWDRNADAVLTELAQALRREGRWKEALEACETHVSRFPDEGYLPMRLVQELAKLHLFDERPSKAIILLADAVRRANARELHIGRLSLLLARAYLQAEEPERASEAADAALEAAAREDDEHGFRQAVQWYSKQLQATSRWAEAQSFVTKGLDLAKERGFSLQHELYLSLARSLAGRGRANDAIRILEAGIAACMESGSPAGLDILYHTLVDLHVEAGDLVAGRECARQGLVALHEHANSAGDDQLHERLVGITEMEEGKEAAAAQALVAIDEMKARGRSALLGLYTKRVDLYRDLGRIEEAIAAARAGADDLFEHASGRGSDALFERIVTLLVSAGRLDEAAAFAPEAVQTLRTRSNGTGVAPIYWRLVRAYREAGETEMAEQAAQEAIEGLCRHGNTGIDWLYGELISMRRATGDLDGATATARRALTDVAEHADGVGIIGIATTLIDLLQEAGDTAEALLFAPKALDWAETDPSRAFIYARMAELHELRGEQEPATEYWALARSHGYVPGSPQEGAEHDAADATEAVPADRPDGLFGEADTEDRTLDGDSSDDPETDAPMLH
jgi:tetratricopeptide (TPR) repeat protein